MKFQLDYRVVCVVENNNAPVYNINCFLLNLLWSLQLAPRNFFQLSQCPRSAIKAIRTIWFSRIENWPHHVRLLELREKIIVWYQKNFSKLYSDHSNWTDAFDERLGRVWRSHVRSLNCHSLKWRISLKACYNDFEGVVERTTQRISKLVFYFIAARMFGDGPLITQFD